MNNSKDFDDILKQLKVIVGSNNYIDDVLKMGSYLSDTITLQIPIIIKYYLQYKYTILWKTIY